MSRVQLALNVTDIEASVDFYSKLFGTQPAKRRPGYANFAIAEPPLKLVLIENRAARDDGVAGALNHLGVEVETPERGAGGHVAALERGTRSPISRSRPPAATRSRTRPGSTTPTGRPGRCTPCSPMLPRRRASTGDGKCCGSQTADSTRVGETLAKQSAACC